MRILKLITIFTLFTFALVGAATLAHAKGSPTDTCACKTKRYTKTKQHTKRVARRAPKIPTRTITKHDTLTYIHQPIYNNTIIREKTTLVPFPEPNPTRATFHGFGQLSTNNYPASLGGGAGLTKGPWEIRGALAGSEILELSIDALYSFTPWFYAGAGLLGEWSTLETTTYDVTVRRSVTPESKRQSKRKKGKRGGGHNPPPDPNVTVTIIARETQRQFDLSPAALVGVKGKGNVYPFLEGRLILSDEARAGLRGGFGVKL